MKYELEIYEPDSKLDALQTFKSDVPFMREYILSGIVLLKFHVSII